MNFTTFFQKTPWFRVARMTSHLSVDINQRPRGPETLGLDLTAPRTNLTTRCILTSSPAVGLDGGRIKRLLVRRQSCEFTGILASDWIGASF